MNTTTQAKHTPLCQCEHCIIARNEGLPECRVPHNPKPSHTPTPWMIFAQPNERDLHPLVSICRDKELREDLVCNHCSPEDAKFIIRAANNHDSLLEALQAAHAALLRLSDDDIEQIEAMPAIVAARAAIQAATSL